MLDAVKVAILSAPRLLTMLGTEESLALSPTRRPGRGLGIDVDLQWRLVVDVLVVDDGHWGWMVDDGHWGWMVDDGHWGWMVDDGHWL